VEGNSDVGILEVAPAVVVELLDGIDVDLSTERLIEELDGRDRRMSCMVVADLVEDFQCVFNRVALTPARVTIFSRVVETVL